MKFVTAADVKDWQTVVDRRHSALELRQAEFERQATEALAARVDAVREELAREFRDLVAAARQAVADLERTARG
jgi:hypothetical protein